ncbi:unnamed protein product [Urochloa humidicola]
MSVEELKLKAEALTEAIICGGVRDAPGRENDLGAIDLARFAVDAHNKNAVTLLASLVASSFSVTRTTLCIPAAWL